MKSKDITNLFAAFSKNYDEHMSNTNHTKTQEKIIDLFLPFISGIVLDIATGTGKIAKYLSEKTNCIIYGIDNCPEMLEEAKSSKDEIEFVLGNVKQLPYNNNSIDVITCCYGFYWFDEINEVISEVKRVLKPGGLFIVLEEEFHKGDSLPRFSQYKKQYLKQLANLENYVGIKYLKKQIIKQGFNIEEEVRFAVDEFHDTVGIMYRND